MRHGTYHFFAVRGVSNVHLWGCEIGTTLPHPQSQRWSAAAVTTTLTSGARGPTTNFCCQVRSSKRCRLPVFPMLSSESLHKFCDCDSATPRLLCWPKSLTPAWPLWQTLEPCRFFWRSLQDAFCCQCWHYAARPGTV